MEREREREEGEERGVNTGRANRNKVRSKDEMRTAAYFCIKSKI